MGEPRPGQIVDNIFLSIQQVKIDTNVVASEGDILVRDTGTGFWVLADGNDDQVDLSNLGLVQTRVDIDTTGLTAGVVSVEVFGSPSYIYAVAGGAIPAGSFVQLSTNGQKFIIADAADLAAGFVVGRMSRLSTDSAGNNAAVDTDIIILKMGVN